MLGKNDFLPVQVSAMLESTGDGGGGAGMCIWIGELEGIYLSERQGFEWN